MQRILTLLCVTVLLALTTGTGRTDAAELILVEQENCHWCHKWDAEIGTTYDSTPVGRIAPLRRVDIGFPKPADLAHINLGRATPVFILIDDGVEIGRVRGYPGRDTFWMLLKEQLLKLPDLQPRSAPPTPSKTTYSSSKKISRWVLPL